MGQKTTKKTTTKSASRQKKIIKWLIIAVAAAVAVFGVYEVGRHGGYWGEPDTLRMIKKEKLASKDLLGLELVSYKQAGEGDLVMKTVRPSVSHVFRVSERDEGAIVARIVESAESDGWVYDPSVYTSATDRRIWRKASKNGDVRLVLYIEEREDSIEVEITGYDY